MSLIGKVIELWRYPVSTVGGEQVEELEVPVGGMPDDRTCGLVDRDSGAIADPLRDPRWKPSLEIQSRVGRGRVAEIKVPGGEWLPAIGPEAADALSGYFGFPVEIRSYAGRSPDTGGPVAVNRYQPSDLHLLTTASIAELQALHPSGNPDRRRFRPSLLIEMPAQPGMFPESHWLGRTVRIGTAVLGISDPTRRCGLTVMSQNDIPNDPDILRHLVRRNGHNMGVYATVAGAGTIRLGDSVEFVAEKEPAIPVG